MSLEDIMLREASPTRTRTGRLHLHEELRDETSMEAAGGGRAGRGGCSCSLEAEAPSAAGKHSGDKGLHNDVNALKPTDPHV